MRAKWFKAWSVNATRHFQHNELDEAFRSRAEREINYYDTYQTRRTINVRGGPFPSPLSPIPWCFQPWNRSFLKA